MSKPPHGDNASTSGQDFHLRPESFPPSEHATGFLRQLQQVIGPETVVNPVVISGVEHIPAIPGTVQMEPIVARPLLMGDTIHRREKTSELKLPEKRRASSLTENLTEDDRMKRRREINRRSQRRIRERRTKEIEELRSDVHRCRHENDQLLRQIECINAEKAELLRQIQEITEKWQQAIAENAVLNRENLNLRSTVQEATGNGDTVP